MNNNKHELSRTLLPVTLRHRTAKDRYVVLFDLPMKNDDLDNLMYSIDMLSSSECVIDHIGNSLLEKFEGEPVNIDALNFLAKRMYSFTDEDMQKYKAVLHMIHTNTIADYIDLSYNLDSIVLRERSDVNCNCHTPYGYIDFTEYDQIHGLSVVMDVLYDADQGTEFEVPYIASVVASVGADKNLVMYIPFRSETYAFLNDAYPLNDIYIENIDDASEYAMPLRYIRNVNDLKSLNELALKITADDFDTHKWRTYVDEYGINNLELLHHLCDHMKDLAYDETILSEEEYAIAFFSKVFHGSRDELESILCQFDLATIGRKLCQLEHTLCTANGLISSKTKVMEGVTAILNFPSREEIEKLRERYPEGTRICLGHMNDTAGVEDGMTGSVEMVDDAGQIHMLWDNGRGLALIPKADQFEVLSRPEQVQAQGMQML